MKDHYPALFPDEDDLWDKAIFAFDTNVLLDLYRVSDALRDKWFTVFKKLADRLWLPHQVGFEFFTHRSEHLRARQEEWAALEKKLATMSQDLKALRTEAASFDFEKTISPIVKAIGDATQALKTMGAQRDKTATKDDPVFAGLAEMFQGKIGEAPTQEEMETWQAEADRRFRLRLPPGFMDGAKTNGNQFGDFVIWSQMVQFATKKSRSIIFISGDSQKGDWMTKKEPKRPLPALMQEMRLRSGQFFLMLSAGHFLQQAVDRKLIPAAAKKLIDEQKKIDATTHVPVPLRSEAQPFVYAVNTSLGHSVPSVTLLSDSARLAMQFLREQDVSALKGSIDQTFGFNLPDDPDETEK